MCGCMGKSWEVQGKGERVRVCVVYMLVQSLWAREADERVGQACVCAVGQAPKQRRFQHSFSQNNIDHLPQTQTKKPASLLKHKPPTPEPKTKITFHVLASSPSPKARGSAGVTSVPQCPQCLTGPEIKALTSQTF